MNQASKRVLDQALKLLVALDVYVEKHSFLPDEQSDGGDLARRCKARRVAAPLKIFSDRDYDFCSVREGPGLSWNS